MPGMRWQKLDDYRGEGFRNASNGAEIIAAPIDAASAVLALQVEPVKTMAVKSLRLALLDEAGRTIGKQTVNGLTYVKFPVSRTPGRSDVFRLSFLRYQPGRPRTPRLLVRVGRTGKDSRCRQTPCRCRGARDGSATRSGAP